uniref:Uncharacterized protein n=1 Tax=viral metagenome TaxID=1070528 RepID=A0A6C0JWD0_9ZZZZ
MSELYDVSFLCTYKQIDNDDLYRIQLLQAFQLMEWNDEEVATKIDTLYDKTVSHFKKIYDRMKQDNSIVSHLLLFLGKDPCDKDLFRTLFMMDTFQELHSCICDILNQGRIQTLNYKRLEMVLFASLNTSV